MSKQFSLRTTTALSVLILAVSVASPVFAQGWQLSTLHSFGVPAASANGDISGVILGKDGKIYGTCAYGGVGQGGIVFQMNKDGSGFQSIHNFTNTWITANTLSNADGVAPFTGVIQASDGRLYGCANGGGTNDGGTLFSLNVDGSDFRVIYDFPNGVLSDLSGALIEGTDGKLYGNEYFGGDFASGSVFRLNKDGSSFETIHEFNVDLDTNGYPDGPLLLGSDGVLYGTTGSEFVDGGVPPGKVFKLNPDGSGFQVLHDFANTTNDGTALYWSVTEGPDGALYGTTYPSGSGQGGVIFKVRKDGSGYRVVYRFSALSAPRFTPSAPFGPLLSAPDGLLYGFTQYGGPGFWGTLFSFDVRTDTFHVMDTFGGSLHDARFPEGALARDVVGNFYGASKAGGIGGAGTVFCSRRSGGHNILHSFNSSGGDGSMPDSQLSLATNGLLYGTTRQGGLFGQGTVYQIDPNSGNCQIILNASARPVAVVADPTNSDLYLTTLGPANNGLGVLYRLTGGKVKTLHRFGRGKDGVDPGAPLVASDGRLYGLTDSGGTNHGGVLYRIDKDGRNYKVLYNLNLLAFAYFPLIEASDGMLYGVSSEAYVSGIAFKIAKDGTGFTLLHTFNRLDPGGESPSGPLLEASDGFLYGTTQNSSSSIIYRMDKSGTNFQVLYTFGLYSSATGLVQGNDNALYGMDSISGAIFRFQTDNLTLTNIAGITPYGQNVALTKMPDGSLCGINSGGGEMQQGAVLKLDSQ